jgi:nitrous oxidase accessory protein NosD
MAITFTYPIATPKASDLVVGTQTPDPLSSETDTPTRNFTVQSLVDLAVGGTYLSLAGGTIAGNLAIDSALTLKVNSGFANISTDVTGTILVGKPSAGINTSLNVSGNMVLQGTGASITLTSTTAAIYMTSPDGTIYKVTMGNGGVFVITQA